MDAEGSGKSTSQLLDFLEDNDTELSTSDVSIATTIGKVISFTTGGETISDGSETLCDLFDGHFGILAGFCSQSGAFP